jgi:heme-degrading monooxygenase HmoA
MDASSDPFAGTPEPPYVAVIFTSVRRLSDTGDSDDGYAATARRMAELAREQPGFLGMESARDDVGLTVSYWTDESAALEWKAVAEHLVAQYRGRDEWYADYRVRIATVTRDYSKASSLLAHGSAPPSGESQDVAGRTQRWRSSSSRGRDTGPER